MLLYGILFAIVVSVLMPRVVLLAGAALGLVIDFGLNIPGWIVFLAFLGWFVVPRVAGFVILSTPFDLSAGMFVLGIAIALVLDIVAWAVVASGEAIGLA